MTTTVAPSGTRSPQRGPAHMRRRPRSLPGWQGFAVLGVYLALGLWLFWPLLGHLGTHLMGGRDGYLLVWWVEGVPHALLHLHDPLLGAGLGQPSPVNAMWNGSIVLPSILMTPVTLTAGPVVSYNLLLLISAPISAGAAYWMCRVLGAGRFPSFLGGLLFGFGPYVATQSAGHAHISIMWFPPVAVILLHRILVTQRGSPFTNGALLGVAATAQLLTGEEILASTVILSLVGVGFVVLTNLRSVRTAAPYAARSLLTAGVVGGVLAALPIWVEFAGPNRPKTALQDPTHYVTDVANIVGPTARIHFDPLGLGRLTKHIGGNITENTAYLGVPLIVLSASLLWIRRRDPVVRFSAFMAVVAEVLSLGDRVHVEGRVTSIPMPLDLVTKVPVLDSLLPARFSAYVLLFLGLLVARGLSGATTSVLTRAALVVLTVASVVFLIPNRPLYAVTVPAEPTFFTTGAGTRLPERSMVVISPTPEPADAIGMLWQADSKMRFDIMSGYAAPWSLDYPDDVVTHTLDAVQAGRGIPAGVTPAAIRADLRALSASAVVLGPGTAHPEQLIPLFTAAIGAPPVHAGGVTYWLLR